MYRKQFPECTIRGDYSPTEYEHMLGKGMIPYKCRKCNQFFEGMCLRNMDKIEDYMNLDFGPCDIIGETHPIAIEKDETGYEIFVPAKCARCNYLSKNNYSEYKCNHNNKIWKAFGRSLDWGNWKPNFPMVGLGPKIRLTREIISLINNNQTAKAIRSFRIINPYLSFKEAKDSVIKIANKL